MTRVEYRVKGKTGASMMPLVFAWLYRLAQDELGATGYRSSNKGPDAAAVDLPTGGTIDVWASGKRVVVFESSDSSLPSSLGELARRVMERAASNDRGPFVWWRNHFTSAPFGVINLTNVHGMRVLSEQRFLANEEGLDGVVHLRSETKQDGDDPPADPLDLLRGGVTTTTVTFRTHGPSNTAYAENDARAMAGYVRAALVLATGVAFRGEQMFTFSARAEEVTIAEQQLASGVPELWFSCDDRARQVPLSPALALLGNSPELHARIRGFLGCYEVAVGTSSAQAAVAFFVAAIEALATPPTNWRKKDVVNRFVAFVSEIAPESIERIMAHKNFREAFGERATTPKKFLDELYDLRSRPFHGGLGPAPTHDMTNPDGMRVALASELARDVFARFLDAPRSPLTGHADLP